VYYNKWISNYVSHKTIYYKKENIIDLKKRWIIVGCIKLYLFVKKKKKN